MKFINLYLVGYVVFLIGAVLALWKSGILAHISGGWLAIGFVVAAGIGLMFSVSAGKPAITKD
jgi:hypothetical protein